MALVGLSNIHIIHAPIMQTSVRISTLKENRLSEFKLGF